MMTNDDMYIQVEGSVSESESKPGRSLLSRSMVIYAGIRII